MNGVLVLYWSGIRKSIESINCFLVRLRKLMPSFCSSFSMIFETTLSMPDIQLLNFAGQVGCYSSGVYIFLHGAMGYSYNSTEEQVSLDIHFLLLYANPG